MWCTDTNFDKFFLGEKKKNSRFPDIHTWRFGKHSKSRLFLGCISPPLLGRSIFYFLFLRKNSRNKDFFGKRICVNRFPLSKRFLRWPVQSKLLFWKEALLGIQSCFQSLQQAGLSIRHESPRFLFHFRYKVILAHNRQLL